jgi:hypothetical protein
MTPRLADFSLSLAYRGVDHRFVWSARLRSSWGNSAACVLGLPHQRQHWTCNGGAGGFACACRILQVPLKSALLNPGFFARRDDSCNRRNGLLRSRAALKNRTDVCCAAGADDKKRSSTLRGGVALFHRYLCAGREPLMRRAATSTPLKKRQRVQAGRLKSVTQEDYRLKSVLLNPGFFARRDDSCSRRNGLLRSRADHKNRWSTLREFAARKQGL